MMHQNTDEIRAFIGQIKQLSSEQQAGLLLMLKDLSALVDKVYKKDSGS